MVFFLSYWIDTWITPNPGSRAVAALSLVQSGTWRIDALKDYTQDKSEVDGHYYSDKAPLPAFLLYPILQTIEWISPSQNLQQSFDRALWLGAFAFAAIPVAVYGTWVWSLGGVLALLAVVFGSFIWIYGSTFFGHALAGAFVVAAYREFDERRRELRAGAWLGLAFLTEFPTALALPAFAFATLMRRESSARVMRLGAGFLPFGAVILAYNAWITGNPLTMVYSYVSDAQFAQMRDALGFRAPSWVALWGLSAGASRGLLYYAPAMIPALLAFIQKKRESARIDGLRSTAFAYLLFSLGLFASYYMWQGGWAYGPRHLIPAAMLLGYALAKARAFDFYPRLTAALAFIGFSAAMIAKMTVKYMISEQYGNPVVDYIWPQFVAGKWNADALPTRLWGLSAGASVSIFALAISFGVWWFWRFDPRLGSRSRRLATK